MSRFALVVLFALSTGCASTTVIRSHPSGAIVRNARGEKVGKTPYSFSGSGIINSQDTFTLEKPGYEETAVTVRKDQVNGIMMAGLGVTGLIFLPLAVVAWPSMLWAADYRPIYEVDLTALPEEELDEDAEALERDERRVSRRERGEDDRREVRRDDERRGRKARAVSARAD